MNSENTTVLLVDKAEEDQVSRNMVIWLNTFPNLPEDLIGDIAVNFEFLAADGPCMALSTIQSAYKTKRYIYGGYQAEYQFKIIYRIKPGKSIDKRLKADEVLNELADWANLFAGINDTPFIGQGKRVIRVEPTTRASIFAVYENGDEDHQILMKMTYEVNV